MRPRFDPSGRFVVKRPLLLNGVQMVPGQIFPIDHGLPLCNLRGLYYSNAIDLTQAPEQQKPLVPQLPQPQRRRQ